MPTCSSKQKKELDGLATKGAQHGACEAQGEAKEREGGGKEGSGAF